MKISVFIAIVIFITGCKSTPLKNIKTTVPSSQGIIVGSIAWPKEGAVYSHLVFKFRSTSTMKEYNLEADPVFKIFYGKTEIEFSSSEYEGSTFAMAIPEGEYEFYNFSMMFGLNESWSSKQDYSIPFRVSANEITYLGEIAAHVDSGSDFLGGTVFLDGFWTIKDEQLRDLVLLKKQQADLFTRKLNIGVPQKKKKFTSLVLLPSEKIKNKIKGK